LGWQPKVSFEEGVQTMLHKIDHWRDAPVWDSNAIAAATADWFAYLGHK
jgi:UDP-glucose 4-epimerase